MGFPGLPSPLKDPAPCAEIRDEPGASGDQANGSGEVSDDGTRAGPRQLPPEVVASLRTAFAGEVAERLPRLQAFAAQPDPAGLADALRDAHSLGSSAVVVNEPDASRAARAAERLLEEWPDHPQPEQLREHVTALTARLDGWQP